MGKVKKIGIGAGITVGAFFVLLVVIGLTYSGGQAASQLNDSASTKPSIPQTSSSQNAKNTVMVSSTTKPLQLYLPARADIGTELPILNYTRITADNPGDDWGLGNLTQYTGFKEAISQKYSYQRPFSVNLIRFDSADNAKKVYSGFTSKLYEKGGFSGYKPEGVDATCFGRYLDLSVYERVTLYCQKADIIFRTNADVQYSVTFAQAIADKIR